MVEVAKGSPEHQMQEEERETGAVAWSTYVNYQKRAGGTFWMPIIVFLLAAGQAAQGTNSSFSSLWYHLTVVFSWQYLGVGLLDIQLHSRLHSGAIHGALRWFGYVLYCLSQ